MFDDSEEAREAARILFDLRIKLDVCRKLLDASNLAAAQAAL
jgi:hypothetical protein